jgi:hypothetical protein
LQRFGDALDQVGFLDGLHWRDAACDGRALYRVLIW